MYLDVSLPDKFSISGIPFSVPGPLLILAAIVQFVSAKVTMPYVQAEKGKAKKTKENMLTVFCSIYSLTCKLQFYNDEYLQGELAKTHPQISRNQHLDYTLLSIQLH